MNNAMLNTSFLLLAGLQHECALHVWRPAARGEAHRNRLKYNPAGMVAARTEQAEILVHRLDLSSAVVHWCAEIDEGRAFEQAFAGRGGYVWSKREDTGLFWSDDPAVQVGTMLQQLKVPEMDAEVGRIARALKKNKPTLDSPRACNDRGNAE